MSVSFPIISSDRRIQSRYERMRRKGESHTIAEMCAAQSAPKMKGSERALMEGALLDNNLKGKLPAQRASVIANARKAGINPTGKIWLGELAREGMGSGRDPLAWVSGKDDVIAACRANGVGSARFGVKPPQYVPEPKQIRLNPKIARRMAREKFAALRPEEQKKTSLTKLVGEITERHGAKRSHL